MPFSHAQKTLARDAFAFAETRLMQPVMIVIGEQAAATEIAGEQRAGAPAASHSLKAALERSPADRFSISGQEPEFEPIGRGLARCRGRRTPSMSFTQTP